MSLVRRQRRRHRLGQLLHPCQPTNRRQTPAPGRRDRSRSSVVRAVDLAASRRQRVLDQARTVASTSRASLRAAVGDTRPSGRSRPSRRARDQRHGVEHLALRDGSVGRADAPGSRGSASAKLPIGAHGLEHLLPRRSPARASARTDQLVHARPTDALVTGPGTPITVRPRPLGPARGVQRAAADAPPRPPPTPRDSAAMSRLRARKRIRVGAHPGGASETTRPDVGDVVDQVAGGPSG